MENLPFCEQIKDGWFYRTFKSDLEQEDLKWHYDDEHRIMVITHETDWKFQYDNQLPIDLKVDTSYVIPKGEFHRLIKGIGDLEVKILKLTDKKNKVSKNLQYHLDNNLTLSNSIFRLGSDAWCDLINEVRELYFENKIDLTEEDRFTILTDAGKKGIFENEIVPLDAPFPISENEYAVFINENGIVKKITFK